MTFTRTANGLQNYPAFFKCDLMVYTEGKNGSENTFDEKYYEALIKNLTNFQSVKVKTVGNKTDAINYFNEIIKSDENNSIVIIDKDLVGVSSSIIEHKKLFITYGYSWENDFWTLKLCEAVIANLTINDVSLPKKVKQSWNMTFKHTAKISSFDAACQINGITILPKKSNSCGIKLSLKKCSFIQSDEFKHHVKNYRDNLMNCNISNEILRVAMNQSPCKIVQGHLWEFIAITIISEYYKVSTKNKTAAKEMIKNIAFSEFIKDPLKYLTPECKKHFSNQFFRM